MSKADVYYWDGGANGAGRGTPLDGSGVWSATTPSWLTASSGETSDQVWVNGNEADFSSASNGTGPYTVTLGGNITTSQIDLNSPGTNASYTFNLSGYTLTTLSSASGDGVNVGAGSNTTFTNGTLVDMPNAQTAGHPGISMRGGTLTLGPGSVVETDYISCNTPTTGYSNALYFNGATVRAVEGNYDPVLYYTSGGSTSSTFTGAFIRAGGLTIDTSTIEAGDSAYTAIELPLSHDPALSTADGGLTKVGAGGLYLYYTNSYTGPTTVNGGTLYLDAYQTETASNYVVNAGAVLNAATGNAVVGVSGTNTVTLNGGATLTTTDGVPAHLAGVALNGGTVASGAPDPTYGTWYLNSNGYLLVTAGDTATLSAQDFYMQSGSYLGVNVGSTLLVTGNFANGSAVSLYGTGTTVFSGDNINSSSGKVTLHDHSVLQLQANAGNTTNGVSEALGNLPSGGFQITDSDAGSATLELRSDTSVTFDGTTNIGGAYLATDDFDVNNLAGVANSGPQGNTLTIGSFDTYGSTVNITGGNGYTLAIGSIPTGYGQSLAINAVSANVTFGSIGTSSSTAVSTLGLNASGGSIGVTGAVFATGATTVTGSNNVTLGGSLSGTSLVMNGTGVLALGTAGTSTSYPALAVNSGKVKFTGAGGTSTVAGLNISSGQVDIGQNTVYVNNASLTTVQAEVKSGYASGAWSGAGIVSSSANSSSYGVGFMNVSSGVEVTYALYGDTNLDGRVGSQDFATLRANFGTGSTWSQGDFNYDGRVGSADFALLRANFGLTATTATAAPAAATAKVASAASASTATANSATANSATAFTPPAGEVGLVINTTTGDAELEFNNASIQEYEIYSPGGELLPGNLKSLAAQGYPTFQTTNTTVGNTKNDISEEGSSTPVMTGTIDIGNLFNTMFAAGNSPDLDFSATNNSNQYYDVPVDYVSAAAPEPTSLLLLGVAAAPMLGRRRGRRI